MPMSLNHESTASMLHPPGHDSYSGMKLRKSQHASTVSPMSTPVDRVREVIAASSMTQGEFAAAIDLDAPKLSKSLGAPAGSRRRTTPRLPRLATSLSTGC